MYEKTIKSIESYLGDYPLTIAHAKMEDIDHIEAIKSHLDNAKADLKILKTVREKGRYGR